MKDQWENATVLIMKCLADPFKVTLWDCCVVANDAWLPLGVFGVIPNPQNVHNVHVHGALLWKMTEFIFT